MNTAYSIIEFVKLKKNAKYIHHDIQKVRTI